VRYFFTIKRTEKTEQFIMKVYLMVMMTVIGMRMHRKLLVEMTIIRYVKCIYFVLRSLNDMDDCIVLYLEYKLVMPP
jgi:hypothetical protein